MDDMGLTPRQRAEKIIHRFGINPNWGKEESIGFIESQIREAVAQDSSHAAFYSDAKAEAYEDCAKIADKRGWKYLKDSVVGYAAGMRDGADLIAKEIRQRKNEVLK